MKHEKAFEAITDKLIKTLMLAYSDPKADDIIQVDGSMKGLGEVQLQKGRPVKHASRTLKPAETEYSNMGNSSV